MFKRVHTHVTKFLLFNKLNWLFCSLFEKKDGGNPSRSNTTQLLVNVRDVNDNAPRFYTALFQESVVENVPIGHSIVRVQAYDADDGENARITYQIHSFDPAQDSLPFGIDPDTGWIVTVRDLDREENHHHEFEVIYTSKPCSNPSSLCNPT